MHAEFRGRRGDLSQKATVAMQHKEQEAALSPKVGRGNTLCSCWKMPRALRALIARGDAAGMAREGTASHSISNELDVKA